MCLRKSLEKSRTAGMYNRTSMMSTVKGGEEGWMGGWREKGGEWMNGCEREGRQGDGGSLTATTEVSYVMTRNTPSS